MRTSWKEFNATLALSHCKHCIPRLWQVLWILNTRPATRGRLSWKLGACGETGSVAVGQSQCGTYSRLRWWAVSDDGATTAQVRENKWIIFGKKIQKKRNRLGVPLFKVTLWYLLSTLLLGLIMYVLICWNYYCCKYFDSIRTQLLE